MSIGDGKDNEGTAQDLMIMMAINMSNADAVVTIA
jgi:hypothetical protein